MLAESFRLGIWLDQAGGARGTYNIKIHSSLQARFVLFHFVWTFKACITLYRLFTGKIIFVFLGSSPKNKRKSSEYTVLAKSLQNDVYLSSNNGDAISSIKPPTQDLKKDTIAENRTVEMELIPKRTTNHSLSDERNEKQKVEQQSVMGGSRQEINNNPAFRGVEKECTAASQDLHKPTPLSHILSGGSERNSGGSADIKTPSGLHQQYRNELQKQKVKISPPPSASQQQNSSSSSFRPPVPIHRSSSSSRLSNNSPLYPQGLLSRLPPQQQHSNTKVSPPNNAAQNAGSL